MPDQEDAATRNQRLPPRRAQRRRRRAFMAYRRRRQAKALLAGGLVLGVGATATFAAWTDQENATGEFHAGEFAIEANINDGGWQSTNTMLFNATGMYPGQSVYAPVLIRTTPDTTVDGALTITGEGTTGILAPELSYRATASVLTPTEAENFTCGEETFTAGADYVFDSATGPEVPMDSSAESNGTHTVTSGAADVVAYCFDVQLAADASNEAQGQSAEHVWTWNAESIVPD